MAASPSIPNNIAAALRYGPSTQSALQRSQYLMQALQAMQASGGENIRSGGELAAKLLATALLQRNARKAEGEATNALRSERESTAKALVAGLRGQPLTPDIPATAPMGIVPQQAAQSPVPQQMQPQPMQALPSAQPQPQPQQEVKAPIDAVWGAAIKQESGGRPGVLGPMTQYGQAQGLTQMLPETAKSMAEKLGVPWRPELMTDTSPAGAAYQERLGRAYFEEGLQKYGGDPEKALMYYHGGPNEDLWGPKTQAHAKAVMSRIPQQDVGQQVMAGSEGLPPDQIAMAQQPQAQSFAPAGPSGAGAVPAAVNLPQAAAAGSWPMWKPTQQQISLVESLLADPRTYEQGVAEAQKIRAKMAEPAEAEVVSMNGVSFYVSKTPGQGGQPVMIPVPDAARTQVRAAQDAGLPMAPQGAYVQQDPFGNLKEAPFAPPAGYNAGPQGYAPIAGGPADPTRPQLPSAGFTYTGQGVQAPIPGGPSDPKSPANYIDNVTKLQTQIRPVVDQAIQLKRNVDAVRTGYQQQNGAGDIAMVNGLQKLIDEGVVREGDVALQLNAQGIEGGIAGARAYMASSGKFDPAIRQKILNTANGLYGSINKTYRDRVMGYRGMVNRQLGEGAFEDVFPTSTAQSLGWADATVPQASAQPPPPQPMGASGTAAAALAEAKRRGLVK